MCKKINNGCNKNCFKTAKATGDLIGNKIADKITSVSKKYSAELRWAELHSKNDSANNESETPKKKRYIS